MGEAKAHGDFGDGDVARALEQFFPGRRQAEPPPILKWGNGQERVKMIAQCSFGHATMSGKVGHRNFPITPLSDEFDRFLEVVRDRPAVRQWFKIEVVR